MEKKFKFCAGICMAMSIFFYTNFSSAADFPTRPIEWYNPWGLGSVTGMVMKIVGDVASKDLGQNVLVLPATGGGGIVGGTKVAKAKPDGYTLLLCNSATNANVLYMKKDVPYTNSDFEFIAEVGGLELGLVVGPNSPFKTLEDYLEYAKKNPFAIKQATIGIGTSSHLCHELLKLEAGNLKIDLVPYKTSTEVRTAVLGGHCHAAFTYGGVGGAGDEFRLIMESGGKTLAVASKSRLKPYPDLPTFSEKGLNVVISAWYGMAGPKGMPKEVSQKLKDAVYKTLKDPQVINEIEKVGFRYEFRNSEDFTSYIREYEKLVKRIVTEAKIPVD
jgi:tripartite-type tricarboxylate transporter receptor subunit TctC